MAKTISLENDLNNAKSRVCNLGWYCKVYKTKDLSVIKDNLVELYNKDLKSYYKMPACGLKKNLRDSTLQYAGEIKFIMELMENNKI